MVGLSRARVAGGVWLALSVVACAPRAPSSSAPPRASASAVAVASACDTATLEAKGDLDGLLIALRDCASPTPAERMKRVETLVTLGDLADARAEADDVLVGAHAIPRTDETRALVARAEEVKALPDAPARAPADVIADARAVVVRARSEREPARWIDLAKTKHALVRALCGGAACGLGAKGERVLLTLGEKAQGAWAADRPLWNVVVHQVPLGAPPITGDALAAFDPRDGSLHAVELHVPASTLSQEPVALPGGGFAVQTPEGIRVRGTGHDPPTLATPGYAFGILALSPKQDALVVSVSGHVVAYDVSTWRTRFDTEVSVPFAYSFVDDLLLSIGTELDTETVVLDVATGEVRLDVDATSALSPNRATLAVLVPDPASTFEQQKWFLQLFALPSLAKRTVDLSVTFSGAPSLEFAGDGAVLVKHKNFVYKDCVLETLARVDAKSATAIARTAEDKRNVDCFGGVHTIGPTSTGLTAAASYLVIDPTLVIHNAGASQELPLAMAGGFQITSLNVTDDSRFVAACGYAGQAVGSFLLDLATKRSTFVSPTDCLLFSYRDGRLVTPEAVVDLRSDPSAPAWPARAAAPFTLEKAVAELPRTPHADQSGLYCRFAEVLMPYEVCGPPP